jgi:translation initiation factor 1
MFFGDDKDDDKDENYVTIRLQQRNGKKCITVITGIAKDLDLDKILKYFKKTFSCNGSISNDEKFGEVITLSGDQKENVYNFFIKEEIYKKDCIIIKGV